MIRYLLTHFTGSQFFRFGLCAFLCTCILWVPLTDPDLWWHLRLGDEMLSSRQIPRAETFSYTMKGTPFVDFYWLAEVFIASLFRLIGPFPLSLIFAIIGALTLFIAAQKKVIGLRIIVCICLVAAALEPMFGVRPVVLTWFFFSLLLLLVKSLPKLPLKKVCILSVLLFLPWVNMHDGFILPLGYIMLTLGLQTLFLLFAWLSQDWLPKPFLKQKTYQKLWLVFAIFIATSLVTPYGTDYWHVLLKEGLSAENKAHIAEWSSLVFRHQLGLVYFCMSVFVFAMAAKHKLWRTHEWIIFSVFFFIGASGVVHAPFFLLLVLPTFIKSVEKIALPSHFLPYAKAYLLVPLLIGPIALGAFKVLEVPKTPLWEGKGYPIEAVNYALKEQITGTLFTAYGWGGYVTYRLPNNPHFIDGRMSSWHRGEKSLIEDYSAIENTMLGFEAILAASEPDWFLLRPQSNLTLWLRRQPQYHVAYEDEVSVIFVSNDSASTL